MADKIIRLDSRRDIEAIAWAKELRETDAWFHSSRFRHITRLHTSAEVVSLRGSLQAQRRAQPSARGRHRHQGGHHGDSRRGTVLRHRAGRHIARIDDHAAAARGQQLFESKARCSTCHVPPLFTEPGWNLHSPSEVGVDDFQAKRSPGEQKYRTAPLRGLFAHSKGGFYHDGRFATLNEVVDHYNTYKKLGLNDQEKRDLIEFLKSL